MILSEEEIDFIRNEIDKSSISIPELKDDLLDHFYCFIEFEMKKGRSFESAYVSAFNQICPNGFNEIQKETIFLLNTPKIIIMKKLTYIIGLIASMSIGVGWLFKILHWPGGGELFTYGFILFVLIFLPLLAFDRYKVSLQSALSEKVRLILGFGSAIVTGLAVLFKMMHFPGATILLIGGAILFIFGFLPSLFFKMYRKALE